MVVGVGERINLAEINAMATKPEIANTFFAAKEEDIESAVSDILDEMCD